MKLLLARLAPRAVAAVGGMVMAPSVGEGVIQWWPPGLEDRALGDSVSEGHRQRFTR